MSTFIKLSSISLLLLLILGCGGSKTSSSELEVYDLAIGVNMFRTATHIINEDSQPEIERNLTILFTLSKRNGVGVVELTDSDRLFVEIKNMEFELSGLLPSVYLKSDEVELDDGSIDFTVRFERAGVTAATFVASYAGTFKLSEGAALADYFPNQDDLFFSWDHGINDVLSPSFLETFVPCFGLVQNKWDLASINLITIPSATLTVDDQPHCVSGYNSPNDGSFHFKSEQIPIPLELPLSSPKVTLFQNKTAIVSVGQVHI